MKGVAPTSPRGQAVQDRLMDMSDADDAYDLLARLHNRISVLLTISCRYHLLTSLPGAAPLADAAVEANFTCLSPSVTMFSPEVDVDMLLSLAKCLKEEANSRQLL
jgi:hypothetical protein